VAPDTTFKLHDTMEKLAAGQSSEQPPLPARPLGSAPSRRPAATEGKRS
jgi:hypothetical protein